MIWLALPLTAWALAAAYGIWAWRDDRYAERKAKRDEQSRLNASFDSIQRLILQWTKIREAAAPLAEQAGLAGGLAPAFPAEGDNFQTLGDASVVRPEFGKKPKPEGGGDSVA